MVIDEWFNAVILVLYDVLQRDKRRSSETREEQIGRVLGKIGPSMFLTSMTEVCAFFLGGYLWLLSISLLFVA